MPDRYRSPRFDLGQVLITPGALEAIGEAGQDPVQFLGRHLVGDWGNLDKDDKAANEAAIAHEGDLDRQTRVFSAYDLSNGNRIWVITEADRSATTILLPSEY